MFIRRFIIRSARKSAFLSTKALHKTLNLTVKIEDKATRLLNGVDFSLKIEPTIPIEKLYYNSIPQITPLNPALPAVGSKPSVVLLLPSLDGRSFYGGTATALVVAARIALLEKRPLKIVQTLQTGHASQLDKFFEREGITIPEDQISITTVADRKYNIYGYLSMHADDIFIASAWWDAYLLNSLPLKKKFIYLVQDFEPIFYNNSDRYILAESTYKLTSFVPLCNTKLMYDFMHDRKYSGFSDAFWFEPAVSRLKSGSSTQATNKKGQLFLYGRPDVHRNLFFSALESIDYAFKAGYLQAPDWELWMAGQDNIPDIQLSSGAIIQNMGKLSMREYIEFSKKIDIAVTPMMAPHPNYPTLEFASIGAAVVTTKYANKTDLTSYSKNIITSDIGIESIAGAIKEAAALSYDTRMSNARASSISDNWKTALDPVLKNILKQL